eukprot:4760768-Amphidinium_carterae.1
MRGIAEILKATLKGSEATRSITSAKVANPLCNCHDCDDAVGSHSPAGNDTCNTMGKLNVDETLGLACCAGATLLAICSERIADVIGLIGASFGSLIVLAWPAAVYRQVHLCS